MQILCEGNSRIVEQSAGMKTVLNSPTILDRPVLQGDSPIDASGASIYGSVIKDGGVYRMWYQAWPKDWDGQDVIWVGCAESDDGVAWRRPKYGIMEYAGSKDNHLTDLPFHSTSVMIDPTAGPGARYRAFGYSDPQKIAGRYPHRINQKGYFTAHSADGLHWELDSAEPLWPSADVITAVWDPYARCARILYKKCFYLGGMIRRAFFTSEWCDGRTTPPVSALIPDEQDDLQARYRGFNSADYYGMGWMPMEDATIGFLWNFRHQLPLTGSGNEGRVDLSLVYQPERGGRWLHLPGRPDWLAAESLPEWGRGAVYTAASTLEVGSETWLYFCGTLERHGWCGAGVNYSEWLKTVWQQQGFAKIGLAKWQKDRLVGIQANYPERIFLRPQVTNSKPGRLVLNARIQQEGNIRVALVNEQDYKPLPGFEFENCEPFGGDFTNATVRWKGRPPIPSQKEHPSVLAQIEITRGTLWAFDFESEG